MRRHAVRARNTDQLQMAGYVCPVSRALSRFGLSLWSSQVLPSADRLRVSLPTWPLRHGRSHVENSSHPEQCPNFLSFRRSTQTTPIVTYTNLQVTQTVAEQDPKKYRYDTVTRLSYSRDLRAADVLRCPNFCLHTVGNSETHIRGTETTDRKPLAKSLAEPQSD